MIASPPGGRLARAGAFLKGGAFQVVFVPRLFFCFHVLYSLHDITHAFEEVGIRGVLNGWQVLGKFGSLSFFLPTSCRFCLVPLPFVFFLLLLTLHLMILFVHLTYFSELLLSHDQLPCSPCVHHFLV